MRANSAKEYCIQGVRYARGTLGTSVTVGTKGTLGTRVTVVGQATAGVTVGRGANLRLL